MKLLLFVILVTVTFRDALGFVEVYNLNDPGLEGKDVAYTLTTTSNGAVLAIGKGSSALLAFDVKCLPSQVLAVELLLYKSKNGKNVPAPAAVQLATVTSDWDESFQFATLGIEL